VSEHDPIPDDPLVRTMLRKLPVPDHRPGFWEDLQVSLAGGAPATPLAPAAAPTETVAADRTRALVVQPPVLIRGADGPAAPDDLADLETAPAAGRRRGRPRPSSVAMALMATAAAVVVGVAATTLLRDGGTAGDVDTAATTDDPAEPDDDAAIAAPPLPGEVTGTTAIAAHGTGTGTLGDEVTDMAYVDSPVTAREAAASFVVAVHEGDAEAAWGLLGPASQAFWESRGRFASALSELAEGRYGAFREARGLTVSSLVLVSSGSGEAGVVVLDGIVDLEGDERRRTLDLPYRYRADAGTWVLEPWGAAGAWTSDEIGFRAPDTSPGEDGSDTGDDDPEAGWPTLAADATVEVTVPRWVETATIAIDGIELAAMTPSSRGVVAVTPSAPFAPGLHRLTVAGIGPDGIAAATVLFRVP
jgi:hypothetical protein